MATVPQHRAALERANATRLFRADLKRRVHDHEVDVLAILSPDHAPGVKRLEAVHDLVRSLPVDELLGWPPRWGTVRVRRLLSDAQIMRENVPLGELTDRQRWAIISALTGQQNPFTVRPRPATRPTSPPPVVVRRPPVVEPEPTPPRPELGVLGFACPNCRSDVGDPCSWYDPTTDRWREPKTPCGDRFDAAGVPRP